MGLQVWLPLNGNTYNLGYKNTTTIVEAQSGVVPSYSTQGKTGKCLNFNGGYYLRIIGITLNEEVSICCWAKTSINDKMPWVLKYSNTNDFRLNLYVSSIYSLNTADSNNNPFKDESNNNISVLLGNKWHHFVVTFGSNVSKLYIDGKYAGTALVFRDPTSEVNGEIRLGGGYKNRHDYNWNGGICDFRVYDHCLSAQEVKKIAQGLVIHYPLNNKGLGKENLIIEGANERTCRRSVLNYSLISTNAIKGKTVTVSMDIKSSSSTPVNCDTYLRKDGVGMVGSSFSFTVTNQYKRYSVTFSVPSNADFQYLGVRNNGNGSGQNASATYYYRNVKLEINGEQTVWAFSANDSKYTQFQLGDNVVQDISGFGRNATAIDISYNYLTKVKYGKSAVFNGTTSRIYANNIDLPNDEMTASIWVKWDSFSNTGYPYIYSLGSNSGGSGQQIGIWSQPPNKLAICANGSQPSAAFSQLNTTAWHHIVFRYRGSFSQLWIDGMPMAGTTNANAPKKQTCLCLGARSNSTDGAGSAFLYPFQGKLSDFRLYTTYLDDDAIKDLYKYNNPEAYVEEDQWEE